VLKPGILSVCFAFSTLSLLAQQPTPVTPGPSPAPATAPVAVAPADAAARINLDVLVTDGAGKSVSELEPFDFSVFDNEQPRKVLGFRRTDALAGSRIDPPEELIIVLDAVNLPYWAITDQRLRLEKFLRQNDGKLAMPTSVFIFSNQGLHVQPTPSKDGNELAMALDKATGTVRARDITGGVYSLEEQFNDSFKTIKGIAENEAGKRGRKMLVWIGSGWPLLNERFYIPTNESRRHYFEELENLTNKLREARISIYSVAPIVGITRELYKGFLKPVMEPKKMEMGNLALLVLVVQTGGRVMDPGNDLVALINDCLKDVGTYYTLTFETPPMATPDQYHSLRVQVNGNGLRARTTSGYYTRP
jgi:VWFA-related protein